MLNLDLSKYKVILDVGGWYNPHPMATHVVDLYPYETRRAQLSEHSRPGEKFSKSTWFQADFCERNLRLPFNDKSVDFVICSHTLEDLREPSILIDEMNRVAKRGYVEVPSRFAEQTVGVSDRAATFQGWNHHKWVIDFSEVTFIFYDKDETLYGPDANHAVPLRTYERMVDQRFKSPIIEYLFEDQISYRISKAGDIARTLSMQFINTLDISSFERVTDKIFRFGRRARDRYLRKNIFEECNIREISQRYSSIDLS